MEITNKSKEYIELASLPVKQRPTMISPNWTREAFTGVRFIIFILFVILIMINHAMAYYCKANWLALFVFPISFALGALSYMSINSGIASSSEGTYLRKTEPIRFWIHNIILWIVVIFINCLAWYIE